MLHYRWRKLAPGDQERLGGLAGTVKQRALDLRGASDPDGARRELDGSNRELADAIVDCAEADPGLDEIEVHRLRSDLARELDRLASGEVRAQAGDGPAVNEAVPADAGTTTGNDKGAKRAPWL